MTRFRSSRLLAILTPVILGLACTSDSVPGPGGDSNGDTTGDTQSGDTASGDSTGGDTLAGDTAGGDTLGGDTFGGDALMGDTNLPPGCTYPVVWQPNAASQAAAEADLTTLSAGASLTWSATRGTITQIDDIDITFGCDTQDTIWSTMQSMVEAHPDLFQMDLSEYDLEPRTCPSINTFPPTTVTATRHTLGPGQSIRDSVRFVFVRDGGSIRWESVSGTYLPTVPPSVVADMNSCPTVGLAEARIAADADTFDYTIFAGCFVEEGQGAYQAAPNDTVTLSSGPYDPSWNWVDDGGSGGVVLTLEREAILTLDPGNWTTDLQNSNAVCPNTMGPGIIIGFRFIMDMVFGTVISKMPGIGCFFC